VSYITTKLIGTMPMTVQSPIVSHISSRLCHCVRCWWRTWIPS